MNFYYNYAELTEPTLNHYMQLYNFILSFSGYAKETERFWLIRQKFK